MTLSPPATRLARYRDMQARLDAEPGVTGKRLGKESRESLYDALLAERSETTGKGDAPTA